MAIPVYVITGSLDAGKTTFLNNMFDKRKVKALVIQFEDGEEALFCGYTGHRKLKIPRRLLDQQQEQIPNQIYEVVQNGGWEEIWVEWNGTAPFSWLLSLFWDPVFSSVCQLKKVIHIVDAEKLEFLLSGMGIYLIDQISESDIAIVRNYHKKSQYQRTRRLLEEVNPGLQILEMTSYSKLCKLVLREPDGPVSTFFMEFMLIICLFLLAGIISGLEGLPISRMVNLFFGMTLQAVPFLLIGILLSSVIQILIPDGMLERWFPKSLVLGMAAALAGGFLLPVCDCASIPVFRSLIKKGIPLPVAVTFMMAAPVMNPVVLLSTFYAFGGNMTVVAGRAGIGALAAVLIGLLAAVFQRETPLLSGGGRSRFICACGCYEDSQKAESLAGKLVLCLRHGQAEFFQVGKYLLIGILAAAVFQALGDGPLTLTQYRGGLAASILLMMAAAFILSLCSSSDAVIARSLASQLPAGAVMGFLVFGPMMDIKNMLMLYSGFKKGFIVKLMLVTVAVCFFLVFLLYGIWGIRL
ncbi:permease [Lacrimispora indolis]|mgnify:CR=1 FL=1|uniref:permease n=1 Tax=Lacrimispora indolis TaxID=69825 RepID=UPI00040C68B8|nr:MULTISPECIES: permease [Lachnospiraceae]